MAFKVEISQFDGPLDLMLHLIHEQQMDIFDLDMDVLTDQYIAYLSSLEDLDLEIESEYLVELATLIEYKSRKLLPKKEDELSDEYEEDPKQRLIQRLLEYQKYKDVSSLLYESYLMRQNQYAKPQSAMPERDDEDLKIEGDPNDLLKAMNRLMRRARLSRPMTTRLTSKEVSTEDRILQIKARLVDLPSRFSFDNLVEDCEDVHDYIVTFLAVLDMAREHVLFFRIDDEEKIWFERGEIDE